MDHAKRLPPSAENSAFVIHVINWALMYLLGHFTVCMLCLHG